MVSSLTVGYSHNVVPLAKHAAVRRRGDFFEAGRAWDYVITVTRPHLPFSVLPVMVPAYSISALAGDRNFKPATVYFT